MDKNICYIRAKLKKDYSFDGIKRAGYKIIIPYKDYNLFMRVMREAWFRLKLPGRHLWYNPEVKKLKESILILEDPLITMDFLQYLRKRYPEARIIFKYDNRVSAALSPDLIRPIVSELWSYDPDDCKNYGLRFTGNSYYEFYRIKQDPVTQYDVLYVGRDKGRLEKLLETEANLKAQGLTTNFYICADRSFLTWRKKIYKPVLPYEDYLELMKKSKAILNIAPEGQRSITLRELEAAFDSIKCITNNKGILDFPLYDPSRYYLLDNNYDGIKEFLSVPFVPVPEETLKEYEFGKMINRLVYAEDAE